MTFNREHAVAWVEIAVTDLTTAIQFYNTVFQYDLVVMDAGVNDIAMFPGAPETGVRGHLYSGKPAPKGQGSTVHLNVPDSLEMTIERCKQAGGEIFGDIIPLPSGRFIYATDLDGNSLGLFESKNS